MHNKIPISWGVTSRYGWELYKDVSDDENFFVEIKATTLGLNQRLVIPVESKILDKLLKDYSSFIENERENERRRR